jgi:TRAP-type mannitol/chloroaromatic compound transport system permease large subunit
VIAAVTLLLALPLGFAFRGRLAGNTAYAVVYLWAFVFQSVYLLLDFLDGSEQAFGDGSSFPAAYGVVAAAVFAVGFGLVAVGHRLRRRYDSSRSSRTGTIASATRGNAAESAKVQA